VRRGPTALPVYNPINLPRISFMSPEHGTEGHARSSGGKDSPGVLLADEQLGHRYRLKDNRITRMYVAEGSD
jgi:hypothetical protein